jgi:hypothetical protein
MSERDIFRDTPVRLLGIYFYEIHFGRYNVIAVACDSPVFMYNVIVFRQAVESGNQRACPNYLSSPLYFSAVNEAKQFFRRDVL